MLNMTLTKIFLLFILCLLYARSALASEYVVMTEEFRPLSYSEDGKIAGLSVEIVREVLKILDHPDNIQIRPWARSYRDTINGPNKILFTMARTPQREALFKWVGPFLSAKVYFYKKRGSGINIETLEDAKKLNRILVARNFREHQFLESEGFTNLHLLVEADQPLNMLMRDRGDLVVASATTLPERLKKLKIDPHSIERTNVFLFENELYLAFSTDIPDSEVRRWQDALDRVKASEKYARILQGSVKVTGKDN